MLVKQNHTRIFNSEEAFNVGNAELLLQLIEEAISDKGACYWAISGGSTPIPIFDKILQQKDKIDWSKVFIFWVDERCVPANHSDSNFGNAMKQFQHIPAHYYRMEGELEDVSESAKRYQVKMNEVIQSKANGLPQFDIILLGMGTDGHTASLFPNTAALSEQQKWVTSNYIPKLDANRITLSYPIINNAKYRLISIKGAVKKAILEEIQELDIQKYPIQGIYPSNATDYWMVY